MELLDATHGGKFDTFGLFRTQFDGCRIATIGLFLRLYDDPSTTYLNITPFGITFCGITNGEIMS